MKLSVFYDHIIQAQEQTGKDIDTILKYVKDCGIDALEIRLSHLQEDKEVADKIQQAGLSVSCIFEFYEMGKVDETAKIKAHLDMAKSVSAPNIMIVPGFLEQTASAFRITLILLVIFFISSAPPYMLSASLFMLLLFHRSNRLL